MDGIGGEALAHVLALCIGWAGFDAPVRYPSAADHSVIVRDLDGDGAPDILASGNQVEELGAFSLFTNHGDGTFAPERTIPSGFGEHIEALGDLDGDGHPDLVASQYWSNGIAVYHGPQFNERTFYATATHGGPTLIADFDHDGKLDVVSLSYGSGNLVRYHFFPGLGNGALGPKTTIDTQLANGDDPSLRTIGGKLEMLVGVNSGYLAILRYEGGSLTITPVAAGPSTDITSTFADINGDGVADIVDSSFGDDEPYEPIFVRLGKADGTFGERKQLLFPRKLSIPFAMKVADVDNDGRADLIVADFQKTQLYVYRGNGAGGFEEGIAVDAGGPVNGLAVADVNGDQRVDIVTVNDDHTVSVLLNRGACPTSRRRAVAH